MNSFDIYFNIFDLNVPRLKDLYSNLSVVLFNFILHLKFKIKDRSHEKTAYKRSRPITLNLFS